MGVKNDLNHVKDKQITIRFMKEIRTLKME